MTKTRTLQILVKIALQLPPAQQVPLPSKETVKAAERARPKPPRRVKSESCRWTQTARERTRREKVRGR